MKIQFPFIKRKKKDNKNPLKYKCWSDISIKLYDEIVKTLKDEELSTFNKNVRILSLLTDKSDDEILNMNIDDVQYLTTYTNFLSDFNFEKKKEPKTIIINNLPCTINYDLKKFTYSQFVDFQIFYQQGVEKYMQNILSTIIIPDNHNYGEKYDIQEFTEKIYSEMSITDAQTVMFFFAKSLVRSFNNTRIYLESTMKKMMKEAKTEEEKKNIQKAMELLDGFTF